MTITQMPKDIQGHAYQALNPKTSWEIDLLRNVPSALLELERHSVIRIVTDTECHVAFDDTLATVGDMMLPAGHVEYFKMPNKGGLSFITANQKGTVYVSLME